MNKKREDLSERIDAEVEEMIVRFARLSRFLPIEGEEASEELEDRIVDLREHLISQLDKYIPEKGSFKAWAYTVLKNKTADIIKQDPSIHEKVLDFNADPYSQEDCLSGDSAILRYLDKKYVEDEADNINSDIDVKIFKEKLGDDYKEILELTESGYSVEEIAEILGISKEAIWKRKERLRGKYKD